MRIKGSDSTFAYRVHASYTYSGTVTRDYEGVVLLVRYEDRTLDLLFRAPSQGYETLERQVLDAVGTRVAALD